MKNQSNTVLLAMSLACILSGGAMCLGDGDCWSSSNDSVCSPDCTYSCGPSWFTDPGGWKMPAGMTTQLRCKTYSTGASYPCSGSPPPGTVSMNCGDFQPMCCSRSPSDPGTPDPLGLVATVPVTQATSRCTPPDNG